MNSIPPQNNNPGTLGPRTTFHGTGLPILPAQHHMLTATRRSPKGSGTYLEQIVLRIDHDIDIQRFITAWIKVAQHHSTMRSGFTWSYSNQPIQYISPLKEINIEINDWSPFPKTKIDEYLSMFVKADRRLDFSFSKPPLFRLALLKTDTRKYICVWSFHHVIADKRTMFFILRDLFLSYQTPTCELEAPEQTQGHIKPPSKRNHLQLAKQFWIDYLGGGQTTLNLPFKHKPSTAMDKSRRKNQSIALTTGAQSIRIGLKKAGALNDLCHAQDIPINFLLMGIWAILLSHYSGKTDILLGATQSGKQSNTTELDSSLLPVRISLNPEESIFELLNQTQTNWIKSKTFEQYSIHDIQSWVSEDSASPLFDIVFSYTSDSLDSALNPFKAIMGCTEVSRFERLPFLLCLKIQGTAPLAVTLNYDRRRFDNKTIKRILGHFTTGINAIIDLGNPQLKEIPILSAREKQEIMQLSQTIGSHKKPDSCLHHLFDIQAASRKDEIAVSDPKGEMTYGQMLLVSNQIANYFITQGAPRKKIALFLTHDRHLIAFILGVLKSGSAYVQINPGLTDQRVNAIIQDSGCDIIVTSPSHGYRLEPGKASPIMLDRIIAKIKHMDTTSPSHRTSPGDIAYIQYPPNPQGKLRGVLIDHSALVAFTRAANEVIPIEPGEKILQLVSGAHDTAIEKIFPALTSGATTRLQPLTDCQSSSRIADCCTPNRASILCLSSTLWEKLVKNTDTPIIPKGVHLINITGKQPTRESMEKWQNTISSKIRLVNTFGPPEMTVESFWVDHSEHQGNLSPATTAAQPYPNVSFCILNQFKQIALPGSIGELYMSGPQTTRGYGEKDGQPHDSFVQLHEIDKSTLFFRTNEHAELIPGQGIQFHGIKAPQVPPKKGELAFENIKELITAPLSPPPIILIGNSMNTAREYKKANRMGHPFFHAPIFIHLYGKKEAKALSLGIPQIAEECIQDILKAFPTGPYIIIGSCQNSLVAHEVAVQLTQMDQEIELLIIIDENWNQIETNTTDRKSSGLLGKIKKEIPQLDMASLTRKIMLKIKKKILHYYISLDAMHERIYHAVGRRPPTAVQFRAMETLFYRACDANPYLPPKYNGRVHLLYSKNWIKDHSPKLNTFYTGDVQKLEVNISHSDWFEPEQIKTILSLMDK